ncbi:MAG: hypothetical protein WC119_00535 [Synergistaceae bacterium]
MKKPALEETIYRLPPDNKHPKGMRVRKYKGQYCNEKECAVVCVKDGHVFYTKKTLTREE